MRKIYLLFALAALLLLSCRSGEYLYKYNESTARYLQPSVSGFVTPMTADLTVSPTRITHTETFDNELSEEDFRVSGRYLKRSDENETTKLLNFDSPLVRYMKNYTIGQAVKKYEADIIIAPIFEITTTEDYRKITVTISGYPASYVNFRKTTDADIKLMDELHRIGTNLGDSLGQNSKVIYVN